jgi:hypothetical protein
MEHVTSSGIKQVLDGHTYPVMEHVTSDDIKQVLD